MAQSQTFNNVVYSVPVERDLRWGPALTRYLVALGTYAISPAGGTYTLTAELNLGASFGVLAAYFKSAASNIASAGLLRLAHSDSVTWRNNANSGDLALTTNASDQLVFNGSVLNTLTLPVSVANGGTGLSSTTAYAVLVGGTTTTGALQTPGIGSTGQVLTSQGPGVLPIWSAAGTGSGTVNAGTANQLAYYAASTNAVNGLTAITASRALASDVNGLPVAATTTAAELNFVNGVTSAIQTQINTKAPTASPTFTGTVAAFTSGQITFSPTTTGIKGTTTNDSAAAGNVGEYIESVIVAGSAVSVPTSATWVDITTIALTAGDWEVSGLINYNKSTSVPTNVQDMAITTTSGNSSTGAILGSNYIQTQQVVAAFDATAMIAGYRLSLSGSSNVYLKVRGNFSSGAALGYGRLSARRMR